MSPLLTGRERYEWLVPPTRAVAHAFIPGAQYSLCRKPERYGFAREELQPGEPRRARCPQCMRILARNPEMVEVES
jgi:hypothetical protein